MMQSKAIRKSERGQSLTELALSFMIIMFVLSGIVDLGRAFFIVIALRDAAQEGAVYASVHPPQVITKNADPNLDDPDLKEVRKRVKTSSSAPVNFSTWSDEKLQKNIDVVYTDDPNRCSGFDAMGMYSYGVTVTVYYDFQFSMPLIQPVVEPWLEADGTLRLGVPATHTILFEPC